MKEAYELAEHHSDFETLVFLCTSPIAGTGSARVQMYIERFGQEFAFPLYQYYIDQGMCIPASTGLSLAFSRDDIRADFVQANIIPFLARTKFTQDCSPTFLSGENIPNWLGSIISVVSGMARLESHCYLLKAGQKN